MTDTRRLQRGTDDLFQMDLAKDTLSKGGLVSRTVDDVTHILRVNTLLQLETTL